MLTIDFYMVDKKENSTYYPDGSAEYSLGCSLKEPSSVLAPQIRVNLGITWNPSRLNFAHIEAFHRWYYVTDWTWSNGCWEASLNVDALASWKWEIGQTEFYVLRASTEFSGNVTDTLYPMLTDATVYKETTALDDSPWESLYSDGCYILGVTGEASHISAGDVTYYAMNQAQFQTFSQKLWNPEATAPWNGIEEFSDSLSRAVINPLDYIVSTMWYPTFPWWPSGADVTSIKIGYWSIDGINAKKTPLNPKSGRVTFPIHSHPQAARGEYLNYAPYTQMWVEFPPFGEIPLDPVYFIDMWEADFLWEVDFATGRGWLRVGNLDSGIYHLLSEAQVGVPFQMSDIQTNLVSGATTLATNLASNLADFIGLGSEVASIGNFASAVTGAGVRQIGETGCAAVYGHAPVMTQVFYPIADEFLEHRGRPLMKRRTPNALGGGYIMVADGDVECHAMPSELSAIKSYLEGGFFYE